MPWPPRSLSLALQGGGSFGAFTWGVLDRLLDEPAIAFDAISGASAGAVNAVVMAAGLIDGGRSEAKARLARFWRKMSAAAAFLPSVSPSGALMSAGLGLFTRSLSPRQFNPFNLNPLRDALEQDVDFERLRATSPLKLLIGATRVRDGKLKIFNTGELTVEAVLASACLPQLHHAVELDGEAYWDGGYASNPPLIPLMLASDAAHLLIVQAMSNTSEQPPTVPSDIAKRLDQINFNATLNAELEALKLLKLLRATPKLRRLRIGRISAQDEVVGLAAESASDLDWRFLERLRDSGRLAAEAWLRDSAPAGWTQRPPGGEAAAA